MKQKNNKLFKKVGDNKFILNESIFSRNFSSAVQFAKEIIFIIDSFDKKYDSYYNSEEINIILERIKSLSKLFLEQTYK